MADRAKKHSAKADKGGRKRKQAKDPNAPKRALSAFFWFSNDERPKVKKNMPEAPVSEIAKELGKRWAKVTSDTKQKYEALAAKDKARYEKEMNTYKSGGAGGASGGKKAKAASPKKKSKKEESEEEEEEEAEDGEEAEEDEEEEEDD